MGKMEDFLGRHEAATQHSYRISLTQFFEWKQTDPNDYIKDLRKMKNGQKEKALDQYEKDIEAWWQHIKKTWTPKYTRNAKLNAIRQYLIEYRIELPLVFWKRLKTTKDKGACAATQDRAPTRHELRKIILEGKPIARTMFLIASCTGMRIGEILALKTSDIKLHVVPVRINIRGETTKTGDPRTVFVTEETAIYLRQWIHEERKDYLVAIRQRMLRLSKHKKFEGLKDHHKEDGETVFPITRQAAEKYWQLMLKRANLDQRDATTNMRELHIHTLRKYFRTNLVKPLGLDVCEALMGHRGYLTQCYRRYSDEDLAKLYQENQDYVTVIQEPKSLEKLDADSKVKNERIRTLEEELEGLKFRMNMMEKIEKMGQELNQIKTKQ